MEFLKQEVLAARREECQLRESDLPASTKCLPRNHVYPTAEELKDLRVRKWKIDIAKDGFELITGCSWVNANNSARFYDGIKLLQAALAEKGAKEEKSRMVARLMEWTLKRSRWVRCAKPQRHCERRIRADHWYFLGKRKHRGTLLRWREAATSGAGKEENKRREDQPHLKAYGLDTKEEVRPGGDREAKQAISPLVRPPTQPTPRLRSSRAVDAAPGHQ
ncbi:unnamed protein product [Sympodiomycopsis kandeliae]